MRHDFTEIFPMQQVVRGFKLNIFVAAGENIFKPEYEHLLAKHGITHLWSLGWTYHGVFGRFCF